MSSLDRSSLNGYSFILPLMLLSIIHLFVLLYTWLSRPQFMLNSDLGTSLILVWISNPSYTYCTNKKSLGEYNHFEVEFWFRYIWVGSIFVKHKTVFKMLFRVWRLNAEALIPEWSLQVLISTGIFGPHWWSVQIDQTVNTLMKPILIFLFVSLATQDFV